MVSISAKAKLLPVSNGSRFYKPFKTKVALIADKDMLDFYENSAQITYITPSNWENFVGKVDVLLITNAKQGLNGEWWGMHKIYSEKRRLLSLVIEDYRVHGVKTVFYTKEYSGDYKVFLDVAKLCDWIFTASEKRVADYQTECGHDRVYTLKFGVNPTHHNPIGFKRFTKIPGAVFSGDWDKRFIEKVEDAETIFDGIVEANQELSIVENYFGLQNANYFFADRFLKNILDAEKEDLSVVHKLFDWAVNINSSNYNKSAFSDYVYALQAGGNIVLSNYNEGINNFFPHVFTVVSKEEVSKIMSVFDKEEMYEHQVLGIREIMMYGTSYQRMGEMLGMVGIDVEEPIKKVAIIVKEDDAKMRQQFARQSYPHKDLILEEKITDDILKEYDFVTYFSDGANYGTYYLEDMLNAFKYTDVDFITKEAYFLNDKLQKGVEHDYVVKYEDKVRTVFSTQNYKRLSELDNKLGVGYAIDHFEFNMGTSNKTAIIEANYKLSVIIPVFNNGDCLYSKAFNSLRRSTMFQELEIIIVDDGSTDRKSLSTIERLAKKYDNVKTYFYPEGGSGSASRPRNKGVELSTTDFITYLDPDDEAINDGFKKLYEEIIGDDYCLVVGNATMITHTKMRPVDYYEEAKEANNHVDIVIDPRAFLIETNFKPMHLMSLIVKKEIILGNDLRMVEGAFGEDTLFYHELVLNAACIKLINEVIFLYYRSVENSATNKISTRLFERYLIREKIARNKYASYGILQEYLERRFEHFFKTWYLLMLKQVPEEHWVSTIKVLKSLLDIHTPHYDLKDEDVIKFYDLAIKEDYKTLKEVYVIESVKECPILKEQEKIKEKIKKAELQHQAQVFREKISGSFLLEVEEKVKEIPASNGSRYYEPFEVNIAIIADECVYEHCKNSAALIYVTPDNYKDYVGKVDVFLITNAQTGLDCAWAGLDNPKSNQRSALTKMITDYRKAGAKIIYCATGESPDDKILEGVGKKCDYIFTSSTEKIAMYKKRCKTSQVHALKWGVNPLIHNPIGCRRFVKYPSVIFSRSKLDDYPRINEELRKVFDGVVISDYGLSIVKQDVKIIWQHLALKNSQDFFPPQYMTYMLDKVNQEFLPNMHKLYDWAINISRVDSQIITASVCELQAMGNLVLSNENVVIGNSFPNVFIIEDEFQVKEIISSFSEDELYRQQMLGVRKVMSGETIFHCLCDMLGIIGIDVELPVRKVAVVVQGDSSEAQEMYQLQSYQEKEVLFANDLCDEALGKYDFIAFFSEKATYGSHYLEDMLNAFKYTDVDFVTKEAYVLDGKLVAGIEHDYVDSYEDKARTVFSTRNYRSLSELDNPIGIGYASDHFEFEINTGK